jgi:2-oxoacid:acceptor oxidoreductase gamma subunit (pyruvate/2-ketoisovalerate family)
VRETGSGTLELKQGPKMIEIRLQGRGGQGVVVASEILARACFEEGMYPQCYSLFGGERRGAPVAAFVRISDSKIYLKCDIDHPNHLILFDKTLFSEKEILEQVVPGGFLLFNMDESYQSDAFKDYTVGTINALEISKKNGLGAVVNTAVLGAYIRLTQIISLERLLKVTKETVPAAIDQNVSAAKEAYEKLSIIQKK